MMSNMNAWVIASPLGQAHFVTPGVVPIVVNLCLWIFQLGICLRYSGKKSSVTNGLRILKRL